MKFTPHITFSRIRGGDAKTPYQLSVSDAVSGALILEINMTAEQFAGAIMSAYTRCNENSGELINTEIVNKKKEFRIVQVPEKPNTYGDARLKVASALAAPYEVDGWQFEEYCVNTQSFAQDNKWNLRFVRYVD